MYRPNFLPLLARRRAIQPCIVAMIVVAVAVAGLSGADTAVGADAALRQRIRDMREGLRDVPLPVIVEALSGHRVLPWDGSAQAAFAAVAADVRAAINREGVSAARVNEAGNAVESFVVAALRAHGFAASRPAGPSGRAQAAGYPDVLAEREDGPAFYIEVKSFGTTTEDSTQRTFYLSPSADFKVTRDAHHLLIAIELEKSGAGGYRAVAVRWLDLSRLRCDLKYEFNASNRDLYRPEAGLVVITLPP